MASEKIDNAYPASSPLFDGTLMNEQHIREQLDELSYAKQCHIHYLAASKSGVTKRDEIDISEWASSSQTSDLPDVEIFFVPQVGEKSINLTKPSLPLLLDAAGIPPSFVELLRDNNGILHQETLFNGNDATGLVLQVKWPVSPYVNGSFYWRYDFTTKRTIICLFFSENLYRRLAWIFEHEKAASISPFVVLHAIIAVSMRIIEGYRKFLDSSVCRREASTGTTLVSVHKNQEQSIEQYPPLFDSLHHVQQELLYFENTIKFQTGLVKFLHKAIGLVPFQHLNPAESEQRQKVSHAIGFNLSKAENAYEQVQILAQRIRIQLGVVESRLNQSSGRTQVAIAQETKHDSMSMKTITVLTMVFLPGTFTATFFSMPFFNAQDGPNGAFYVNHLWWVYIAATIPLTIIVMLLWLLWMWYLDIPLLGRLSHRKSAK